MSPDHVPFYEALPDLFELVHKLELFEDGKRWADATPLVSSEELKNRWHRLEIRSVNEVSNFVNGNFSYGSADAPVTFNSKLDPEDHIRELWHHLLRKGGFEAVKGSSLIPLPFDYIVPGGRFNEIYYWDSYFTMLGLAVHGYHDVIEDMIKNFDHFIQKFGFIPNGNRSYFLSRSQPPFFALMVELLMELKGEDAGLTFISSMEKEHAFWMKEPRCVQLKEGYRLNRYADTLQTPRIEMYRDDLTLAQSGSHASTLFMHLRAACESGWDFSSRWMDDARDLKTIRTHDILPVDLNALLYKMEKQIAKLKLIQGDSAGYDQYFAYAEARKNAMRVYCWEEGWYDFDIKTGTTSRKLTAASLVPLFVGMCTPEEATITAETALSSLLAEGGLLTTNLESGQQWDAPNGWAPLQWMAVKGLDNYGMVSQANELASRWLELNRRVYQQTGKMLEKYNVKDMDLPGGGGEYPVQDGFGWTNGVFVALKHRKQSE